MMKKMTGQKSAASGWQSLQKLICYLLKEYQMMMTGIISYNYPVVKLSINSLGVFSVTFLKDLLKVAFELNPQS